MSYSALSQYQNARFPSELSDVRGYEVRTRDGDDKVGRVEDLICSADGQIRYLDVDLGGFFNTRHVAVPVGAAQLDRETDVVWITGLTKDQIKALPDYAGDASLIDERYESEIREVHGTPASDADLYDQGRFYAERGGAGAREARLILSEEQLRVGKRQVEAGEVGVHKTVETEHVRETVGLAREEVTIERHPVSADAAGMRDAQIGEDEIRVPVMREEVVVEKRVVPTEEIVLRKQAVTEEQNVEADLRRERAVVDDAAVRARSRTRGDVSRSGAADRASRSGPADRATDALDDLKDRVDADPSSRPGPDPTDRRI
jgi:uncharacterized protein (TIGR02271 family)